MDLKSDFLYRLEQDQELQRVRLFLPSWVTCHPCSSFPEGNTKCVRLDCSTNTHSVFRSAGCSTGVDVGVSCAVPGKNTNLFFGSFSFG